MNDKKSLKALIVDDEKVVRDFLARFLKLEGVESVQAKDASQAIKATQAEKFDMIFLDIRIPGINGLELFRMLKKIDTGCKYIMMTGYAVDDMLKTAEEEGAIVSLKKPFEMEEIEQIIERVRNG
ncbi:MAG: response regulator [Candidatus Omnitrophica bacterium]|nr:response regulator [Candidatus Omnitrophota bacterium]